MYDLELNNIIEQIKKNNAKRILLQLPDGLKPRAKEIQEDIKKKVNVEVLIWAGSNFGACDLPSDVERLDIDLVIHFGHSAWVF
jgi:2-(3-amino-3-carboxypropyl)histidine synthase